MLLTSQLPFSHCSALLSSTFAFHWERIESNLTSLSKLILKEVLWIFNVSIWNLVPGNLLDCSAFQWIRFQIWRNLDLESLNALALLSFQHQIDSKAECVCKKQHFQSQERVFFVPPTHLFQSETVSHRTLVKSYRT